MGTGISYTHGTSSQEAKDFIQSVKSAVIAEKGSIDTPFNNPNTNSKDTWDHIKNFWLRDGHLFALMIDDNANDMVHGREWQNKQRDVLLDNDNGDLSFKIRPSDHHMEHLRTYCNHMGGDLWMPSSQAEFDDIMERDGGVCQDHGIVYEDGVHFQTENDKTEIYLNVHREGYLGCPQGAEQLRYQVKTSQDGNSNTEMKLDCPKQYKWSGIEQRSDTTTDINAAWTVPAPGRVIIGGPTESQFRTTDPFFASTMKDGMCSTPNTNAYDYSVFLKSAAAAGDPNCNKQTGDKPYIAEACWDTPADMRYQKFVQSDIDSVNDILSSAKATDQFQKDCVVVSCNHDVNKFTGIADDTRAQSEWNMVGCNQHRHTGICRIRAFGCSDPTYKCKDNYSRTCGDRSVYTKSLVEWRNQNVQDKINDLIESLQNNDIAEASIPKLNDDLQTEDVIVSSESFETISNWQETIEEISDLDIEDYKDDTEYPQCTCECKQKTWLDLLGESESRWSDADTNRGLYIEDDGEEHNNVLGSSASWSCEDKFVDRCWTGSETGQCIMSDNGYEAFWKFDSDRTSICSNSCCDPYLSDDHHTQAERNEWYIKSKDEEIFEPALTDVYNYKPGNTMEVECLETFDFKGDRNFQSTVVTLNDDLNACYPEVECVIKPCECPIKENGYCHKFDKLDDSFDESESEFWEPNRLLCRCNEGYVNVGGVNNLPYDILRCADSVFNVESMGTCVPLQCANPPDLLDETENFLIGLPTTWKASLGDRIEYVCADGYRSTVSVE